MAMQVSYLVANAFILMQSLEIGLSDIIGANFVLAGALGLIARCAIVALSSAHRARSHRRFLLPAAAIIASSVLTSHAMARLEHRLPLVFVTALHQLATAAWLGSLPFLLLAIRRASSPELVRQLSARFSRLALASVAILASAGLILSLSYVGSLRAIYGTSYRAMVATKAILFGLLLLLGALNFRLVRHGEASAILASLKRFGEAEIGIGVAVILAAASVTSPGRVRAG
jgi:copper resistance protein D